MPAQVGDFGVYHGNTPASDVAALVTQANEDGTVEVSLFRPGFETLTPMSGVVVGTGEGQWSPRT